MDVKGSSRNPGAKIRRCPGAGFGFIVTILALFTIGGTAFGAFYVDRAACHPVAATGMCITSFQSVTNLGPRRLKVINVTAGQTAAIRFSVTNSYGAKYALSISNLGTGGLNDTNHHLVYSPDYAWTKYFPGTSTNFFLAGPTAKSPAVWTFNLEIQTNTPSDVCLLRTQMAGYDSNHRKWSQQEDLCLQVVAPDCEAKALP